MRTREFRITMPVDVKEYHLAQMWSFAEQSKQETGGGEGVEILKNEEFTNGDFYGGKYTSGQYTYKLYHIETKIPTLFRTLLRPLVGEKGFKLHEEAWNAYPYCKTVITNPDFMKDSFRVVLETLHLADRGDSDNVLNWDPDQYAQVRTSRVDIIGEPATMADCDPVAYRSVRADRGPLDPDAWYQTVEPVMTCYKFVTVHCKWFPMTSKMENGLLEYYRKMLLALHQKIWCWTDDWYGLTWEDIRRVEEETEKELDKARKEGKKKGTTKFE